MESTLYLQQHLVQLGIDVDLIEQSLPDHLALSFEDGALSLYELNHSSSKLQVNFVDGAVSYRSKQHLGGENLIKACQIKGHSDIRLLDGTCGLGTDSFLLHQAGFLVTAVEKNPVIHALLVDGLKRYKRRFGTNCFELKIGDVADVVNSNGYDVIYLDPMFPAKEKSAKNKKTMQLFQSLHLGEVDSAEQLLTVALKSTCQRVVIKRPTKSPLLTESKPTFQLLGKNCRFDAYQIS